MNIFYYLYVFAFSSFFFVAAVGWVENPPAVLLNDNVDLYDSLMDAFDDFNGYDHIAMMDEDDLENLEAIRIVFSQKKKKQGHAKRSF